MTFGQSSHLRTLSDGDLTSGHPLLLEDRADDGTEIRSWGRTGPFRRSPRRETTIQEDAWRGKTRRGRQLTDNAHSSGFQGVCQTKNSKNSRFCRNRKPLSKLGFPAFLGYSAEKPFLELRSYKHLQINLTYVDSLNAVGREFARIFFKRRGAFRTDPEISRPGWRIQIEFSEATKGSRVRTCPGNCAFSGKGALVSLGSNPDGPELLTSQGVKLGIVSICGPMWNAQSPGSELPATCSNSCGPAPPEYGAVRSLPGLWRQKLEEVAPQSELLRLRQIQDVTTGYH